MKKHQFYLWLIALAGLITSCSQDKTDMPVAGESNRVSFTASLPQDFEKSGKRALPSATSHSLRCILEVWNKENTPELIKRMEQNGLTGDNVVFDFEIEPGTYDCLFWADFIATGAAADQNATIGSVTYTHYTDKYYKTDDGTNGLKAVSIIADNYVFSTDARDAFFGKYELQKSVAAVTDPTITLTRPFAKLTIKEKDADAYNLCKTMTASYDVPNVFNVLNGTASGSHTASCNAAPAGGGSTDLTLFTDYIFTTSAARETMPEISLTFTKQDNAGAELQPVTIPAGVPVQRNYRTNAAGSLISEQPVPTNGVKLTVNMSENWADENYDFSVWDGTYPANSTDAKALMATAMTTNGGTTAANYVFTIHTASQLAALSYLANQAAVYIDGTNRGKYTEAHYLLATDIDLDNHPWTPISNRLNYEFLGTFDGQGHTVSNMKAEAGVIGISSYCGLFGLAGCVGPNTKAIIRNLIVEGTVTANSDNVDAVCYVGGICGFISNAILQYCRFNGTVSAQTSDSYNNCVGGLVGALFEPGTIQACISNATVTRTGGDNYSGAGGLTGRFNNVNNNDRIKCTNSAWNSGLTAVGIGRFVYGSIDASNKNFTDISGLNALLGDMNSSVADRTYEWKAGGTAASYPVLVKKTN